MNFPKSCPSYIVLHNNTIECEKSLIHGGKHMAMVEADYPENWNTGEPTTIKITWKKSVYI